MADMVVSAIPLGDPVVAAPELVPVLVTVTLSDAHPAAGQPLAISDLPARFAGLNGIAAAQVVGHNAGDRAVHFDVAAQKIIVGDKLAMGSYTVVADDDTAGTKAIDTGLDAVDELHVQVEAAGVDARTDAEVTPTAGEITVADGAATFALTADQVIRWTAMEKAAGADLNAVTVKLLCWLY